MIFVLIPISVMVLYTAGQSKLYKSMKFIPFKDFILSFEQLYINNPKIKGTAIFLVKDLKKILALCNADPF